MKERQLQKLVDTMAGECLAVRLRMLNRAVTRIYDNALRPHGVKVSQMNILVATAKLGTARPADLCASLHLEVSTLSRNVERMKSRGWLEEVPDGDGRARPFRLTAEGASLLKASGPAWKRAQERTRALLGSGAVDLLDRAASSLRREGR